MPRVYVAFILDMIIIFNNIINNSRPPAWYFSLTRTGNKEFTIVGLSRQNRSPQKSVRPDRFWQKNLPKVVPRTTFCCQNQSGRTNFGSQNWSPFANFGPPVYYFLYCTMELSHLGTCIGSYSYN